MQKKKTCTLNILLIMTLITTIIGCNPEPELKLIKSQASKISSLEQQRPIIGDNSFNISPTLMIDVKTLNVTDEDSALSDLRVFFDGDKLKNKTIVTNSNGVSMEITCGGDQGDVDPLHCQFEVMGKALNNVSESFTTNFQVRDITLDKAGKDISNTSDQGKMKITFYREYRQIEANDTTCSFVLNKKEASCDINGFSAFDTDNKNILISLINSETNMQDKITCEKYLDGQKLKIKCALKLLNDLSTYPLSKSFSASFNIKNSSNSALSMQNNKTINFSFSRTPIVYTKKQSFITSATSQVPGVDILWVVDNSGSMADKQLALTDNFESLINTFIPLVNNLRTTPFPFKMTSITTDSYLKSGLCNFVKCNNSGNPLLVDDSLAISDYDQFTKNFNSIVKVGTKGNGLEKSIESLNTFVKVAPKALNKENLLVVIFLSDEIEQSYKSKSCPLDKFTTECNLERVEWSKNQIAKLKTSKDLIKVFSIVDLAQDKADVYKEISKEFSGSSQSIHDPFSSILTNIGTSITNAFLEHNLSFEGTIKKIKSVSIDGKILQNINNEDYVFVAPNKIRIKNLPGEGKTMVVEFEYSNEI